MGTWSYTLNRSGTHDRAKITGNTVIDVIENTSQMFSHSHFLVIFISVPKLPSQPPETTANKMPMRVDIVSLPICRKSVRRRRRMIVP